MDDIDDLNLICFDPINNKVIWMHDSFSRAFDAACAIKKRMFRQALDTGFDGSKQAIRRRQIPVGYIRQYRFKVGKRSSAPNEF